MKLICLLLLGVILTICALRYGRWCFARLYVYVCLRKLVRKANLKFTSHGALWLFAGNGDGKISFTIETPDTVYYIHLCGSLRIRCSYIFKDETRWVVRQYALFGRGQDYTEREISVQKIQLPGDIVTIAREQTVYLFAPTPLGCGLMMPNGVSVPIGPGQDVPGGILHNVDSFCTSVKGDIEQ